MSHGGAEGDGPWPSPPPPPPPPPPFPPPPPVPPSAPGESLDGTIVIVGAVALVVVIVAAFVVVHWRRSRSHARRAMCETSLKQSLRLDVESETDSRPTLGSVDDSSYQTAEVVKKIGRGSSGDVFLVKLASSSGGSKLAVCKRCAFEDELTDEQKHELYNEVRILSSLNHPNIVSYLHSARQQGELCIYMECGAAKFDPRVTL